MRRGEGGRKRDIIEDERGDLVGEDAYVFVEGLGRANVAPCDSGLPGGAGGQLTLFEDERQEGEEWVSEGWGGG